MTASPLPTGTDVGETTAAKFRSRTQIHDADGAEIGGAMLERLVALVTAMDLLKGYTDGVEGLLTALGGYEDGQEGLLGDLRALLTTQAGYLDGVEGLVTNTNAALAALGGYVDGLETLLGTNNTANAAIQAAVEASQPARQAFAITPHDTNAITPLPRQVRVNAAGTVVYRTIDSAADVTITAYAGELLPDRVQYIRLTGTSATGFLGRA